MLTCTICRFETEPDDVMVHYGPAACVCLRCYARETGTARPMPNELRRQIIATLAATETV